MALSQWGELGRIYPDEEGAGSIGTASSEGGPSLEGFVPSIAPEGGHLLQEGSGGNPAMMRAMTAELPEGYQHAYKPGGGMTGLVNRVRSTNPPEEGVAGELAKRYGLI